MSEIYLVAADAYQDDINKGRVRVDLETRKTLGLMVGDIVHIRSVSVTVPTTTAAIVWRLQSEDESKKLIRMDDITRGNIGVSIGDNVKISKADVEQAIWVHLQPVESDIDFKPVELTQLLYKRPVVTNNTVMLRGRKFKIVSTIPENVVVQINETTQIVMDEVVDMDNETDPLELAREIVKHIAESKDIGTINMESVRVLSALSAFVIAEELRKTNVAREDAQKMLENSGNMFKMFLGNQRNE